MSSQFTIDSEVRTLLHHDMSIVQFMLVNLRNRQDLPNVVRQYLDNFTSDVNFLLRITDDVPF